MVIFYSDAARFALTRINQHYKNVKLIKVLESFRIDHVIFDNVARRVNLVN